jgi:hypothetical protein
MPIAPPVVKAGSIGAPIAPSVIVTVRVMPRRNPDENAETVVVMYAFAFSGLNCRRGEQKRSPERKCRQSEFA